LRGLPGLLARVLAGGVPLLVWVGSAV
jgi:hypothetical protein